MGRTTIINWTARRAGGRITINGVNKATGEPIKIVGVDQIKAGKIDEGLRLPPVATDKNGVEYDLE